MELPGDRMLSALTQYEALLPDLLADLDLALKNANQTELHISRAQLNAAVLWSTEWGLELHALAYEAKAAARSQMEKLRAEQLFALQANADECVAAVTDWGWRSRKLGKPRFDSSSTPPAINMLDGNELDFKATSGAPTCVMFQPSSRSSDP